MYDEYVNCLLILQAYKNHVMVHGEEALLPGIDLSHYQLFFVSFGQVGGWMNGWIAGWMAGWLAG